MDLHKEHHAIITYICYSILIVDLVLFEICVNDSWLSAARWPAAYHVWNVTQIVFYLWTSLQPAERKQCMYAWNMNGWFQQTKNLQADESALGFR